MADVFVTQVSKEEAAAFAPPEKTRPKLALQLEEEKPVYVQEDSDDDKSESDGPKVVKTLARQSSGEKPEKSKLRIDSGADVGRRRRYTQVRWQNCGAESKDQGTLCAPHTCSS
jgi:hypothetical protein